MKIPMIAVTDRASGYTHPVGSDLHDALMLDVNGGIHYRNLQNGDGTGYGGDYVFEAKPDESGDLEIEFLSIHEVIEIAIQDLDEHAEAIQALKDHLAVYEKHLEEYEKKAKDAPPHTGGCRL